MSGGGSGAASQEDGSGTEWRRIFDRVEALLPRVEELAADRARSRTHQESSEARENSLHARRLQAEASRRRWKAAYMELPPGANPKLAELQENDLMDSKACEGIFYAGGFDPEETSQKRRKLTSEMHFGQCTTGKKSKGCNFPDMHSLAEKDQVSLNCWLMLLEHEDFYRYIPQCGDEVMYLRQGHESYLNGMRLSDSCPCDRIKNLKAVELCRIEGLGYSAYGESCCTLALKFIDDTSSGFGKQFIITLLELADFADFVVERTRFEATIMQNWTIRDKCKVWCMDDGDGGRSWWEGHVLAITPKSPDFPECPWFPVQFSIEVIRARLHNDYYRTLDAVQHDATVMLANAKSCFSKSSVMTKKILRLSEWVNDNIQSL